MEVDPDKTVPGKLIIRLAARSFIRDSQEGRSYMHGMRDEGACEVNFSIGAEMIEKT